MSRFSSFAFSLATAAILCSTTSQCFAQAATPEAKRASVDWKRVSSFKFDWDHRAEATVILEVLLPRNDQGDFTRIRIRVPGRRDFVLTNKDGWVKYGSDEARLSAELRKANLVRSDYVLVLKAGENRSLLFLFGYWYASSPGSLDVLEVSEDDEPKVVLHRDEFGLRELRDLDNDGLNEIVGYPCLSQEWGDGLLTYDPFNVYKLGSSPAAPANLSLPLSKSYNLEHYYGWAGAKCSEDFAVVLHPPKGGKPVVVTAREAQKITENGPKR